VRGLGTLINVVTIVGGTAIGVFAGHRLPERARITAVQSAGLITLLLGVLQGIETHNIVFPLVAIVAGGLVGELLNLEDRLEGLGDRIRRRVERDRETSTFVEGFVAATLVFGIGPVLILGSIQDGLGDSQLLTVKAGLDGLISVVFASTLGWGVAFSALPIGVAQLTITLLADGANDVLSTRMIDELTATGGVILLGLGLRLLDVKIVRVGSFLPALVIAPVLVAVFAR
jgi:uncharacterized protein